MEGFAANKIQNNRYFFLIFYDLFNFFGLLKLSWFKKMNGNVSNKFIKDLWAKLHGFNISEVYNFQINENLINYYIAPTIPNVKFTFPWINFNFNIFKTVETLNFALEFDEKNPSYYIICDNVIILLVSAMEEYLSTNYNNLRMISQQPEINPKNLGFQSKDNLKRKYKEFDIEIAHLNEDLWRLIFSSDIKEKGIIKIRNVIVHNGWKGFNSKFDMTNHIYVRDCILIISQFIWNIDQEVLKNFPKILNLKKSQNRI